MSFESTVAETTEITTNATEITTNATEITTNAAETTELKFSNSEVAHLEDLKDNFTAVITTTFANGQKEREEAKFNSVDECSENIVNFINMVCNCNDNTSNKREILNRSFSMCISKLVLPSEKPELQKKVDLILAKSKKALIETNRKPGFKERLSTSAYEKFIDVPVSVFNTLSNSDVPAVTSPIVNELVPVVASPIVNEPVPVVASTIVNEPVPVVASSVSNNPIRHKTKRHANTSKKLVPLMMPRVHYIRYTENSAAQNKFDAMQRCEYLSLADEERSHSIFKSFINLSLIDKLIESYDESKNTECVASVRFHDNGILVRGIFGNCIYAPSMLRGLKDYIERIYWPFPKWRKVIVFVNDEDGAGYDVYGN